MRFLLDLFSRDKQTAESRRLVARLQEEVDDFPVQIADFIKNTDNEANLLIWAQLFLNIDVNNDQLIEQDEFRRYVQTNYQSSTFLKKVNEEVLASALKHFKAAVRENEHDLDEATASLTFNSFIKMMYHLHSVGKDANVEADFKLYKFLSKTSAKAPLSRDDSSDKNAKTIEKAAGFGLGDWFTYSIRLLSHLIHHSLHVSLHSSQSGEMT